MLLYKYQESLTSLDPEGLLVNHRNQWWNQLLSGNWCGEVSLIHKMIKRYANENKDFVDIGAHIGTWTVLMAHHFNMTHAFEPCKDTYNHLCGNLALRGISDKVETYSYGLSNQEKELEFYDRGEDGGGNGFSPRESHVKNPKPIKVKTKTLDSHNFDNVGIIKIDVEGFENEVLLGAKETIENNNHPPLVFESWNEGQHQDLKAGYATKLREEVFSTVRGLGYNSIEEVWHQEVFLATKK